MNKEMLEEYILEARALREQVEILARLLAFAMEGTFDLTLDELETIEPVPVKIHEGMIYVG